MNDQELQQLAQTITEALADDCHLPLCMVNETEEVKFIPKFLKLLLRTHCIVSREKVKELYDCYKQHEAVTDKKRLHEAMLIARGSMAAFRDIFGTQLFEERSEK